MPVANVDVVNPVWAAVLARRRRRLFILVVLLGLCAAFRYW
jgi:hypothetical protein